jgi:hypothetical protein
MPQISAEMSWAFGTYYSPTDTFELLFNVIGVSRNGVERFVNIKYRAFGSEDVETVMDNMKRSVRRGEQVFIDDLSDPIIDTKGFYLVSIAAAPGITTFPPMGPEGGSHV